MTKENTMTSSLETKKRRSRGGSASPTNAQMRPRYPPSYASGPYKDPGLNRIYQVMVTRINLSHTANKINKETRDEGLAFTKRLFEEVQQIRSSKDFASLNSMDEAAQMSWLEAWILKLDKYAKQIAVDDLKDLTRELHDYVFSPIAFA